MFKPSMWFPLLLYGIVMTNGVFLSSCNRSSTDGEVVASPTVSPTSLEANPDLPVVVPSIAASPLSIEGMLEESWRAYRIRFIQEDGRIIDYEARDRSISEGQAYAMLRAVLADDADTFDRTLTWSQNNLQRKENGLPTDNLWGWWWGKNSRGEWGLIDPNFASDADIDAITALILAGRRWNREDYLELARIKLRDLWDLSTIVVGKQRYLLPGPVSAFQPQPNLLKLNPSYLAPSSFRMFAQIDPNHDWMSLVESSYAVLEQSARLSDVGLPSDWVMLNTTTGTFEAIPPTPTHQTVYSFDAYRVWWRVALDALWFDEPRAKQFLQRHTNFLAQQWRSQQTIPARIDLQGQPTVEYDTTSQYAMLYPAFAVVDPTLAEEIFQQKLVPTYRNGIWDSDVAYYVQNLAWLGLAAPAIPADSLLRSPSGS